MSNDVLTPEDIETLARARGLNLREMCERADVSLAAYYKWRAARTDITLGTYRKLLAAVARDGD